MDKKIIKSSMIVTKNIMNDSVCKFKDENDRDCMVTVGRYGSLIVGSVPEDWKKGGMMRLSIKQVRELLPILEKFVNTGDII